MNMYLYFTRFLKTGKKVTKGEKYEEKNLFAFGDAYDIVCNDDLCILQQG